MAVLPGGRKLVAAALAVGMVLVPSAFVIADWRATADGTATVTTGTWAAVATGSAVGPWGVGPHTMTGLRRNTQGYFYVANTGTLPLASATYSATSPAGVTLEVCDVAWNQQNGRCSGTTTTLPTGVQTSLVPSLPGEVMHVKATVTVNTPVDVTVHVAVPRISARAAEVRSE